MNFIQTSFPNTDAFGFTERNQQTIQAVFSRFSTVKKVLLFGSRTTGTNRPYSDIDFCIINPDFDQQQFRPIVDAFEECDLPFFVDVLVFHRLQNEDLKAQIMANGKLIYSKAL